MKMLLKFLLIFVLAIMLIHEFASRILHRPLVWLCKYSGKDNFFWAKVTFWAGISLCILGISGVFFLLWAYAILPLIDIGRIFFLPKVANKLREIDGDQLPVEVIAIPQIIFLHVVNIIALVLLVLSIGKFSFSDVITPCGYLLSYVSICFLLDRQSGGKSLFKQASERLKILAQNAKEKFGSGEALPQPI